MDPNVREKMGFGKPKLRFQVDYETYMPAKIGNSSSEQDGSLILLNDKNQGFMVNQSYCRILELMRWNENRQSAHGPIRIEIRHAQTAS